MYHHKRQGGRGGDTRRKLISLCPVKSQIKAFSMGDQLEKSSSQLNHFLLCTGKRRGRTCWPCLKMLAHNYLLFAAFLKECLLFGQQLYFKQHSYFM